MIALAKTDGIPPFAFLLTANQMIDNDYRLPSYLSPSDRPVVPGLDIHSLPQASADLLRSGATASSDLHGDGVAEMATNTSDFASNRAKAHAGKSDDGWLETPEATDSPSEGRYPILAIDCEMVSELVWSVRKRKTHAYAQVLTEKGQELARISVVDFHTGRNIYDALVTPSSPVVDYRTQ